MCRNDSEIFRLKGIDLFKVEEVGDSLEDGEARARQNRGKMSFLHCLLSTKRHFMKSATDMFVFF